MISKTKLHKFGTESVKKHHKRYKSYSEFGFVQKNYETPRS